MRLKKMTSLTGAFTVLCGCSNALYFYETEKIAMSLQGRPDSSQPVQGSLGLKQRVAVVAPPKDPDTMTKARSDAVSMISTFRFRKDKGGFFDLGPVTIQTAFVTGSAATALDEHDTQEVAMAQVIGPDTPVVHARKKRLTDCVTDISDDTKLNAIARKLGITPNIDDPSGTKTALKARIGELKLLALEELEKSDELKSCPQ